MNQWWAFIKKEGLETWRTKRFFLLMMIFIAFGIMNPLIAKLTPEIMKLSFGEDFPVVAPTSLDSWAQFYKNISQMGIYLFAIIFSGTVSQEMNKGTLVNLVTKGMKRWVILLSKWVVLYFQWLLAIFLSFGITYGYTLFYFPDTKSPHPWFALIPLFLFGFFFVSLILFTSTLAKNQFEGLLLTILVMIVGYLAGMFDQLQNWNPISLIGQNMTILQESTKFKELYPSMAMSFIFGLVFLLSSILVLKRKKI